MSSTKTYTSDEIRDMIRQSGLRCTSSRTTVLQRLIESAAPMSHAELSEELVPQGLDQTTIYRNLTDLTDNDLVNRLDLGDHIWRFEFRGTTENDDEHPHFMCTDCGDISCLTTVKLTFGDNERSSPSVGEVDAIFLKGRCTECT